jgi:hypothetical protein
MQNRMCKHDLNHMKIKFLSRMFFVRLNCIFECRKRMLQRGSFDFTLFQIDIKIHIRRASVIT